MSSTLLDYQLRLTSTIGGTFSYVLGGFRPTIFSFGGGSGASDFYMGGRGHPIFYFEHPANYTRMIKLARGKLWHCQNFIDIFFDINF